MTAERAPFLAAALAPARWATRSAALGAVLCTASCGGDPAPYKIAAGAEVSLELHLAERIASSGAERRLDVDFTGRAPESGDLLLTIRGAAHTIRLNTKEPVLFADTRDVAVAAGENRTPDRGMQRLLEGVVGREVRLVLDPVSGLSRVEGFDAALDAVAAGPGGAESAEAREALRGIASDASLRRDLRAAGLAELPDGFGGTGTVTRRVEVFVHGRGTTTALVSCGSGRDHDGSPVIRGKAFLGAAAPFTGDSGLAPPMPVSVEDVSVAVETIYVAGRKLPLRGNTTTVRPYVQGPEITSSAAFTLLADE